MDRPQGRADRRRIRGAVLRWTLAQVGMSVVVRGLCGNMDSLAFRRARVGVRDLEHGQNLDLSM